MHAMSHLSHTPAKARAAIRESKVRIIQSKIASCSPGSITAALLFVKRAHKVDNLVEQDHKGDQPLLSVCDMTRLKAFSDHPSIVFPAVCLLPLQR